MALARHQWRKHGSCTGLSPKEYFKATSEARNNIAIPPILTQPEKMISLTSAQLKQAFSDSNPGLKNYMMSLQCQRGAFREIRICMEKNLKSFRRCEEDVRDTCRGMITLMP